MGRFLTGTRGSGQHLWLSPEKQVCGLTIRSSRVRFAASALALRLSQRRGRSPARLNSGVSWGQTWVQHFEFSDKAQDQGHFLRCVFLPRAGALFSRQSGLPARTKRHQNWLWLQPYKERSTAGLPANNSFKPTPLRGVVVALPHSLLSASATPRCGAA